MPKTQTNADRYIGKAGVVTEQIDNEAARGLVKVLGSVWTARSADGSVIPAGANVEICAIDGVKSLSKGSNAESRFQKIIPYIFERSMPNVRRVRNHFFVLVRHSHRPNHFDCPGHLSF